MLEACQPHADCSAPWHLAQVCTKICVLLVCGVTLEFRFAHVVTSLAVSESQLDQKQVENLASEGHKKQCYRKAMLSETNAT